MKGRVPATWKGRTVWLQADVADRLFREETPVTTDTTTEPTAEDVIALTLAGDDEVTDEIVELADRIVEDLRAAGFLRSALPPWPAP